MNKDISLLWEHNAFTCHFNIMNDITLVFCTIPVTIHFSQTTQASVFMAPQTCTLTGEFNSSLNTLSMIFLILFAPNTTMASIVITVKYRLM